MTTTTDVDVVVEQCNLVVTTTSARSPLITRNFMPGTHVTAMGSDGLGKQEIDGGVVAGIQSSGGLLVADSKAQVGIDGRGGAVRDLHPNLLLPVAQC